MKISWSHCVLKVRDIDAMVSFYGDVLGFRVADKGPLGPDGPSIVFMSGSSSDHHQIAFAAMRGPEDATSLEHCAFRVETLKDVKEMVRRVAEDGRVPDGLPLTHGNAISVYFKDPEGNGLEVFCDTPWHVKQPQLRGWDPSLGDEEILEAVEKEFQNAPEFSPMADYQAKRAIDFGES